MRHQQVTDKQCKFHEAWNQNNHHQTVWKNRLCNKKQFWIFVLPIMQPLSLKMISDVKRKTRSCSANRRSCYSDDINEALSWGYTSPVRTVHSSQQMIVIVLSQSTTRRLMEPRCIVSVLSPKCRGDKSFIFRMNNWFSWRNFKYKGKNCIKLAKSTRPAQRHLCML